MKTKPFNGDRQEILVNDSIYTVYDLSKYDSENLVRFFFQRGTNDSYCTECSKESIFKYGEPAYLSDDKKVIGYLGPLMIEAKCFRLNASDNDCEGRHIVSFFRSRNTLIKMGQWPSKADLDFNSLSQSLTNELSKEDRKELGTAIGLNAHGVGIGSFVYLRRIFENLLNEAKEEAKVDSAVNGSEWDEALYIKSRIAEKVHLLSRYLPTLMVRASSTYSILSKGIHELSETECKSYFELIKDGIIMMLQEKYNKKHQEELLKDIENAKNLLSKRDNE